MIVFFCFFLFWNKKQKRSYQGQIVAARKLIKEFGEDALIKYINSPRGKNTYSLGFFNPRPFVKKEVAFMRHLLDQQPKHEENIVKQIEDRTYTKEQFDASKEIILSGEFDSSACQMVTYYKSGSYRLEPKEEYYVPFIYKINPGVEFILNNPFPVLVDPTRRMGPGKCKIFTRNELEMHHMSFVREDLRIKLSNSSAKGSFEDKINKIVDYYNNWKYPSPVMWADSRLINVVTTENLFNINFGDN